MPFAINLRQTKFKMDKFAWENWYHFGNYIKSIYGFTLNWGWTTTRMSVHVFYIVCFQSIQLISERKRNRTEKWDKYLLVCWLNIFCVMRNRLAFNHIAILLIETVQNATVCQNESMCWFSLTLSLLFSGNFFCI